MEGGFLSSHVACRVARAITQSVRQGCPNGLLRGKRFGGNTGGVAQLVPNMPQCQLNIRIDCLRTDRYAAT